jgi:hypothetical protein
MCPILAVAGCAVGPVWLRAQIRPVLSGASPGLRGRRRVVPLALRGPQPADTPDNGRAGHRPVRTCARPAGLHAAKEGAWHPARSGPAQSLNGIREQAKFTADKLALLAALGLDWAV